MARKTRIKYDSNPDNDYGDGYDAGRRYIKKRKGDNMARKRKEQSANDQQLSAQDQNSPALAGTPNSDDQLGGDNSTVANPFQHSNDGLGRAYDPAVDGTGKEAEKKQAEADKAPENPGSSVAQQN